MATDSPRKTKIMAGLGLVIVQSLVGLLYKVSQSKNGGFHYSTTSAISIAELVKLVMSVSFHIGDRSHHEAGTSRLVTAWRSAWKQLSRSAVIHICGLAFLYAANNQLNFYVYILADPGTVYLFKAASTMIVASIQCTCVGKEFSSEQWRAMCLQGVGMVVLQHNPCKGAARYNPLVYLLMALGAVLTAACSVRNEYLVKNYSMLLNVQNAVLYAGGAFLNLAAFCLIPNPNSKQANIGFFEGYDNPLALGVVFVNSLIGLAITAVYKYADAITKCIASDITAVNLCIISSIFFELVPSITMWCGVAVVCFAVHLYTSAAPAQPGCKPAISETRFLKASAEETEMVEALKEDHAIAGRVVGRRQ